MWDEDDRYDAMYDDEDRGRCEGCSRLPDGTFVAGYCARCMSEGLGPLPWRLEDVDPDSIEEVF